jgi:hypothetical protein
MSADQTARRDQAIYVQKIVEAALLPGGPLHGDLEDLTLNAAGLAADAAGAEGDPGYQLDYDQLHEAIAAVIGEALFRATVAYLETEPAPTPA